MQGLTVRAVISISTKKEEICVKNEEPPPPTPIHPIKIHQIWTYWIKSGTFYFCNFWQKEEKPKKKINKCLVSGNVKIFYGSVGRQIILEINLYRKSMKIIQN